MEDKARILESDAAIKTLKQLGYIYHGAEYWKPPIGKAAESIPVYSQAMCDAGDLPSVGMECFVKRFHQDDSKYLGCYIIGHSQDKAWLVFEDDEDKLSYHNIKNGTFTFGPLLPLTPPIELIDGKAYQFDCGIDIGVHGVLDKGNDCFYCSKVDAYPTMDCTNIQLLEVKNND